MDPIGRALLEGQLLDCIRRIQRRLFHRDANIRSIPCTGRACCSWNITSNEHLHSSRVQHLPAQHKNKSIEDWFCVKS